MSLWRRIPGSGVDVNPHAGLLGSRTLLPAAAHHHNAPPSCQPLPRLIGQPPTGMPLPCITPRQPPTSIRLSILTVGVSRFPASGAAVSVTGLVIIHIFVCMSACASAARTSDGQQSESHSAYYAAILATPSFTREYLLFAPRTWYCIREKRGY